MSIERVVDTHLNYLLFKKLKLINTLTLALYVGLNSFLVSGTNTNNFSLKIKNELR